jgi:hypothetical protein
MWEGTPYREMPLPPGPPRSWRDVIERCTWGFVIVFHALVLGILLFEIARGSVRREAVPFFAFVAVLAALALVGALLKAPRRFRIYLMLPASVVWAALGASLALVAMMRVGRDDLDALAFVGLGLFLIIAGVLSRTWSRGQTPLWRFFVSRDVPRRSG